MTVKVIDASALAALCFMEPDAALVAQELVGARLAAPLLLQFEMANIAWKKTRRHPELAREIARGLASRMRFHIRAYSIDADEVFRLALQTGLTAYDASYLLLAKRLKAPLVTLDHRLAAATVVN